MVGACNILSYPKILVFNYFLNCPNKSFIDWNIWKYWYYVKFRYSEKTMKSWKHLLIFIHHFCQFFPKLKRTMMMSIWLKLPIWWIVFKRMNFNLNILIMHSLNTSLGIGQFLKVYPKFFPTLIYYNGFLFNKIDFYFWSNFTESC